MLEVKRQRVAERWLTDPEKAVRDEAAGCFRGLDGDVLADEVELIGAFIKSHAFADGGTRLMFALHEASSLLPDVVCGIPERLIELQATAGSEARQRHDCY